MAVDQVTDVAARMDTSPSQRVRVPAIATPLPNGRLLVCPGHGRRSLTDQ